MSIKIKYLCCKLFYIGLSFKKKVSKQREIMLEILMAVTKGSTNINAKSY